MLTLKSLGSQDMLVSLWHESDWPEEIRYGTCWRAAKDGRYMVPGHLSGSDYSGSLVERSNYDAFAESFPDGQDVWWTHAPGGHGTYAIVISLDRVPDDVADDVEEWLGALESYPIADDDLHSRMEIEAQDEAWLSWAEKDFIRGIEKRFNCELPDGVQLRDLFEECAEKANRYWENQEGSEMYIDVKEVIAKVTRDQVEALGATFNPDEAEE